ncbi:hypothetical protein HanRHA438_Chr16g0760081 [Helianthus annuus]|nr:hypothetical protein HanIR_Chr16g0813271 [Helianthus annuus]KAJ0640894.1 hypothetical protein HanLR1_Chr16g0620891 [Helianthus annuus]KAJ0644806.1 hypothetical protein HanOQP8_Chr16g0616481 [Helianthus annuus]KAJ0835852.1 hypothetical protein HanRHA438_Chr16g0760081 [Helianthus annuus]
MVTTLIEDSCDDSVCRVETVMKTYDVEKVNGSEKTELLLENTEAVEVQIPSMEEIVEVVEDDKISPIVVMENAEVLSSEDNAAESVNKAVELWPMEEIVEAIEDDKISPIVVIENAEVLSSKDNVAAVELRPIEEIVEAIEDDKMSPIVVMENAEVLKSEDDDVAESVKEAAEHVLEIEATNNDPFVRASEGIINDGEQTQILVKEGTVMDQVKLSFPATFVRLELNIPFGSFGQSGDKTSVLKDSNPETEPECFADVVDEIEDGQRDGQKVGVSVHVQTEEMELPSYCFVVKNPGYEDEKLNEQIKNAELELDEKRRCKDAISDELHLKWESILFHNEAFHTKNMELRAARQLIKSKRHQIDHAERVINKIKNAITVKDIDSKISKAEHILKNGTPCLEDEKQFAREIKQLKSLRAQLALNMGSPDEIQQKDQIEELVKKLNAELKTLKDDVSKAQVVSYIIRRKYLEELEMVKELRVQFVAAEESRKEASMRLQSLKKQLNDKVESFLGKWDTDEEFRTDYISRRNMVATYDIPSCVFPNDSDPKVVNSSGPTLDEIETVINLETLETINIVELSDSTDDSDPKVTSKPGPTLDEIEPMSGINLETLQTVKSVEEQHSDGPIKENVFEEVEQVMKTEEPIEPTEIIEIKENEETNELVKEEIEVILKEKILLEKKMRANEAHERKKQNAKKAPTRAEMKAQQEAQQQEKKMGGLGNGPKTRKEFG